MKKDNENLIVKLSLEFAIDIIQYAEKLNSIINVLSKIIITSKSS